MRHLLRKVEIYPSKFLVLNHILTQLNQSRMNCPRLLIWHNCRNSIYWIVLMRMIWYIYIHIYTPIYLHDILYNHAHGIAVLFTIGECGSYLERVPKLLAKLLSFECQRIYLMKVNIGSDDDMDGIKNQALTSANFDSLKPGIKSRMKM